VIIGVLIFEPFFEEHQGFVKHVAIYPLSTLPQEDHVPEQSYSTNSPVSSSYIMGTASGSGGTAITKSLSYALLNTKIISKTLSYAVQK
jgi:hypothetical protein